MKHWQQRLVSWSVSAVLVLIVSMIAGYDVYNPPWHYIGPEGEGIERRFSGSGLFIVLIPTILVLGIGMKRIFYAWEHELDLSLKKSGIRKIT